MLLMGGLWLPPSFVPSGLQPGVVAVSHLYQTCLPTRQDVLQPWVQDTAELAAFFRAILQTQLAGERESVIHEPNWEVPPGLGHLQYVGLVNRFFPDCLGSLLLLNKCSDVVLLHPDHFCDHNLFPLLP